MSDTDKLKALFAAQEDEAAKKLRRAKKKAREAGKEPFDLEQLEQHYDTRGLLGEAADRAALAERLEHKYYTQYPKVLSLKAFAAKLREAEMYG